MESSMHRLDALPTELLHRVAAFLPCSSILCLCFASRMLYATCYDRLVFKRYAVDATFADVYIAHPALSREVDDWEIRPLSSDASEEDIEDSSEDDSGSDEWWPEPEEDLDPEDEWDYSNWGPTELELKQKEIEARRSHWRNASIFDSLSAGDNARIAFAIEKALSYFNVSIPEQRKDWRSEWEKASFETWLPHLIALRHPSCLVLKPENLQSILWSKESYGREDTPDCNPSTDSFVTVSFCMLALMLLRFESLPVKLNDHDHVEIHEPFYMNHPNCQSVTEEIEWKVKDIEPTWSEHGSLHRYSLVFFMLMKSYFHQRLEDTPFPLLHRLPLISFFGAPVPFHTPADAFTQCHLSGNGLIEFLSGEWVGRCTDRDWPNGYEVAPQLKDIHLDARQPVDTDSPDTAAVIEDTSYGEYYRGHFTMKGTVFRNGNVHLQRTLVQRACRPGTWDHHPSDFKGAITPFGIAGSWTTDHGRNSSGRPIMTYEGFFWFWKKEWAADR